MNPFNVIGENKIFGEEIIEKNQASNLNDRLKNLIQSSDLVLFMKGNAVQPQCGFSANVVAILNHYQQSFKTFNILIDEEVRQGLKAYSNWPTYPQLYFKGKLIGGNDVLMEMHQSGELKELFKA